MLMQNNSKVRIGAGAEERRITAQVVCVRSAPHPHPLLYRPTPPLPQSSPSRSPSPSGAGPSILKLAKSGGAVKREGDERRAAREQRVREYFYGAGGSLQPHTMTVRATDLAVYRIGRR